MKLIFNLLFLSFISLTCLSQEIKVDTIPFSLEKQLLVFEGKVNGVKVYFAFDTGAGLSVANSQNVADASIKVLKRSQSIEDANQTVTRLDNVLIDEMSVGSFKVKKVKGVSFDMPYLKCANLLLLGQDFIKKFNWKIDFKQKVLYLSETPFTPQPEMLMWPVKYGNNRPHITLKLNDGTEKSCLIDFGYTGVLEVNATLKYAQESFTVKQSKGEAKLSITSNMGLTGLGKPSENKDFIMDSLFLGGIKINKIPVTINGITDIKIGVQFFNQFCNTVILNHSQNIYYLSPSHQAFKPKKTFDARVSYKNDKFYITAKNLNPNNSGFQFEIDEEVKTVNGKSAQSFGNECDFLMWYILNKDEKIEIEKMDGTKILVQRS